MLRSTWREEKCPVCASVFPKGTKMYMQDLVKPICETCYVGLPRAVKEIVAQAIESFRLDMSERFVGGCEWRFTDYYEDDGAFECDVCHEEAYLCYTRDSVDGLETYCCTCVAVEYPDLDLASVPIEPPD